MSKKDLGFIGELAEVMEGVADVVDGAIFDVEPVKETASNGNGSGRNEESDDTEPIITPTVKRKPGATFQPAPKAKPATSEPASEPDAKE